MRSKASEIIRALLYVYVVYAYYDILVNLIIIVVAMVIDSN